MTSVLNRVRTSVLEIAYEQSGPEDGVPVLLMHGFPYDPRTYDLRGSVAGGSRMPRDRALSARLRSDPLPRGRNAALWPAGGARQRSQGTHRCARCAPRAVLAGYDWGGRAACVVAALWPDKVRGLVSANGYNIQDIAGSTKPAPPEQEHRLWYQYYLPHRARSCRIDGQSPRVLQAAVATVVAELAVR